MRKRLRVSVHGRVQGVFFRRDAHFYANRFGLVGYADRLENGGIQIEAEGEEENLRHFLKWCHRGSYLAKVVMIAYDFVSESGQFEIFEIRRTYEMRRSAYYFQ